MWPRSSELFGAPRANFGAVSRILTRPILFSLRMLSGWVMFENTDACRWVPKEIDLEPFARWLPKEGFVSCQKLRETRASKNTQSGPSTQFVYPAVARLVSLLLQQTCGVKVAEEEYSMQFDGGSRSAEQCSAAAAVLSVGGKQV